jgi:hypothetical protein
MRMTEDGQNLGLYLETVTTSLAEYLFGIALS